jgi:hypothetical protein
MSWTLDLRADGVGAEILAPGSDPVRRERGPHGERGVHGREQRKGRREATRAGEYQRSRAGAVGEPARRSERDDRGRRHRGQRAAKRTRPEPTRGGQLGDQHGEDPDLRTQAGEERQRQPDVRPASLLQHEMLLTATECRAGRSSGDQHT